MSNIIPFIRVNDGKAAEALTFYKDVFGGETEMMTVGDSPMAKDMPGKEKLVMHSTLTKDGQILFLVMDMMRDKATIGDNVGISVDCKSQKELDTIFSKLEKGGDVFMKPEDTFWGGYFGVVTDKYGVEWMLNFQKEPMK